MSALTGDISWANSSRGILGHSRRMLRSNRAYLLDFRAERSVGVLPDSYPAILQPHGDAPFGACGGGSDFAAATRGDIMTKAKASKVKANDTPVSSTQAAAAAHRPLGKSAKSSNPRTGAASK